MSVQREPLDRIKGAWAWKDAVHQIRGQEEAMAARPPSRLRALFEEDDHL